MIAWDREDYLAARKLGPRYREARLRFVPFNELGSVLKTLLLPQIDPLFIQLFQKFVLCHCFPVSHQSLVTCHWQMRRIRFAAIVLQTGYFSLLDIFAPGNFASQNSKVVSLLQNWAIGG